MGSMNLDHLLNHLTFSSQSNLTTATPQHHDAPVFSKKTVEEVWSDIQLFRTHVEDEEVQDRKPDQDRQPTLGEITLEDFLIKAGVVCEAAPSADKSFRGEGDIKPFIGEGATKFIDSIFPGSQLPQPPPGGGWLHYPSCQQQSQTQQSNLVLMDPSIPAPLMDASYGDIHIPMSSSTLTTLSDAHTPGGKRIAPLVDVADKSVERRQKRMIKNRESAARSRARKQAYTNELENKVSRLEEENVKLRRERAFECVPIPDPKFQLRRTSSGPF